MAETVQQALRERLADDTVAVKYGDRTWTWHEHLGEASAEAAALLGLFDGFGSTETAVIITREPGMPAGSVGRGAEGVAIYNSATVTECAPARFDEHGALVNADEAVGELVNTQGAGYFSGYYNDEHANRERIRHGMYWSGDLAYRVEDGWIYFAGRTADWMRVDGENLAAAPIERILMRLPELNRVAVYAVPDERVGDQVMAAVVLNDETSLSPEQLEAFLAEQQDLSPKAWPRFVRIADDLPSTASNKVLKRKLVEGGRHYRRRCAVGPRRARPLLPHRLTALATRPAYKVEEGAQRPSRNHRQFRLTMR